MNYNKYSTIDDDLNDNLTKLIKAREKIWIQPVNRKDYEV